MVNREMIVHCMRVVPTPIGPNFRINNDAFVYRGHGNREEVTARLFSSLDRGRRSDLPHSILPQGARLREPPVKQPLTP